MLERVHYDDGSGNSTLVSFLLSGGGAFTSVMALTADNSLVFNGDLVYRIDVAANTLTRLFEVLGAGYNGGVTYDAAVPSLPETRLLV